VSFPVRAITLDLDDTLWPFEPIGARIENALH
jgi:FMN hydrolase / 5-amino-6-(5-phospho-D-ribitylamino)uracil phosphatase